MRTHPDDIQHETIGFTRIRAGAPAQHLLVQRRTLGGPRHNNAVHGGLVKAFGEDGTVGDHARGARVQPLEDGPAGGERGGPIQGLRGNAGGTEGRGHGIGQGHRRRKEQGFPVRGMGLERREDLRRGVGREEQGLEFGLDKIPLLGAQGIEVGLEQHLESPEVDEIARLHHLQQGFLIDNAVKDRPQGVVIPPLGRRRDPDHQRPVGMPGPAILQDAPVGGRGGMVRFVDDDGLEIRHEAGETGSGDSGSAHWRPRWGRYARRATPARPQGPGGSTGVVRHGLLKELIAVRQDEGPAAAPLDQEGKHNGFARASRQDEQGPVHAAGRGRKQVRQAHTDRAVA